jgi:chromosome segregation ATPase
MSIENVMIMEKLDKIQLAQQECAIDIATLKADTSNIKEQLADNKIDIKSINIETLRSDVNNISIQTSENKTDIKNLIKFKYYVMGGCGVVTLIFTILWKVLIG